MYIIYKDITSKSTILIIISKSLLAYMLYSGTFLLMDNIYNYIKELITSFKTHALETLNIFLSYCSHFIDNIKCLLQPVQSLPQPTSFYISLPVSNFYPSLTLLHYNLSLNTRHWNIYLQRSLLQKLTVLGVGLANDAIVIRRTLSRSGHLKSSSAKKSNAHSMLKLLYLFCKCKNVTQKHRGILRHAYE